MNGKNLLHIIRVVLVLLVAQLACTNEQMESEPQTVTLTISPTMRATSSPSQTPTFTLTPEPTTTLDFTIPTPAAKTGTIVGLVLWNKEPVAQAAVKLCEEFDYTGCLGKQYSTNSNQHGYYIFQNVKPGSYVIIINVYSTSWWIFRTIDGRTPYKDNVKPDQISFVDPREIYKVDLKISQPVSGETVAEKQPTIKWDEYFGAVYYVLVFEDYEGKETTRKVEENEYTLDEPLTDCSYNLTVTAYNDEDTKISESQDGFKFTVDNVPLVSCEMTILRPPWDANLKGTDIELSWEAHPRAAYYYISIENGRHESILDQVRVEKDQTSYTLSLPPGRYLWDVVSYDESGNKLVSNGSAFYVK